MTRTCKPPTAKIHTGTILRPPTAKDSKGQLTGDDSTVANNVRFHMRPLAGRELESARQQFAAASVLVTLNVNRQWNLTPKDKIVYVGGPLAGRELNIGHIRDFGALGLETEIVCGEGDLSGG